MRALKIFFLVLVSIAGVGLFEQKAEAGSSFYLGFSNYHPYRFHGRPYFYRPYYYRPFGYPYGYGYGSGYGYGNGYGYGYPNSSYYYGYGEVRTEIKPDQAKVYLDGDYVGVADDFNSWYQRLNIEPGKHRLVFRLEGFQPYAVTVRVLPGRDLHIKHQLRAGDDSISENEMRLQRDERDQQYSPRDRDQDRDYDPNRDRNYDSDDDDDDDRYNQGPYGSNGSNGGGTNDRDDQYNRKEQQYGSQQYDPREENRVANGKTMLTIQVEPKDATIYVDGTYYGTADAQNSNQIQVLLANGTHRLEVVRPGFETFNKDFVVNENSARNITIQLEKK